MKSNHSKFFHSLFFHSSTNTLDKRAHLYIPVFALNKKHSQEIKPQIEPISRIYFYNHEFHEFHELGEPWRLLGNHPDGAFAKKAKNSYNSYNSWSRKSV